MATDPEGLICSYGARFTVALCLPHISALVSTRTIRELRSKCSHAQVCTGLKKDFQSLYQNN